MAAKDKEQTSAPAEGLTQTAEKNDGQKRKIAKFTGASVVERRILKKNFEDADVQGVERDLIFSAANDHEIDVTDLPAAAIDLLKKQSNIKIHERA